MTEHIPWLAAFGVVAVFWRQTLSILQRARSFFITKTTVQGDGAVALMRYMLAHYRRSPFGDKSFRSGGAYIRSASRLQEVAWELPSSQASVFFDGWKPLMLGGVQSRKDWATPDEHTMALSVFRFFHDAEELLFKALEEYNEAQSGRKSDGFRHYIKKVSCSRRGQEGTSGGKGDHPFPHSNPVPSDLHNYRVLGYKSDEIGAPVPKNPLDAISLSPSILPAVQEFEKWLESEAWYREKRVPWRRGWLLHGKPGNGKTSLVRALAQKADLPIWSYDLPSLTNEDLCREWKEMQGHAPCIALIEDIDAVFDGRKNLFASKDGPTLTFDCLLNCLGGVEACDGIFIIITTNHPETIDPALGSIQNGGESSRPGRIDRIIELGPPDEAGRRKIAERILNDWPDAIENVLRNSEGQSGAQFTERCIHEALTRFWHVD